MKTSKIILAAMLVAALVFDPNFAFSQRMGHGARG